MFPYVEPTLETADETGNWNKTTTYWRDFTDLQTKFDKVNDVVSEQKKTTKK